jgi:hypothetical protein
MHKVLRQSVLKIHPSDNVLVALEDLPPGSCKVWQE